MNIALDVIVAFIIVFTIWRCASKGFIRSVFDMLKFIVSLIVASVFKYDLAQIMRKTPVYRNAEKAFCEKITHSLEKAGNNIDPESMLEAFESENPELAAFIESMGADIDETVSVVERAARSGVRDLAEVAAEHIIEPALMCVVNILAFLALFLASFLVLRLAEMLLNAVCRLPILHGVNTAGGFIIGVMCAILYSSLFVALTSPIVSNPDLIPEKWDKDAVDKTYIYSYIREHNLFTDTVSE